MTKQFIFYFMENEKNKSTRRLLVTCPPVTELQE